VVGFVVGIVVRFHVVVVGWGVIVVVVVVAVIIIVIVVFLGMVTAAAAIGAFGGFAIVQPFGKDIDGFVQMMNGHLIGSGTQSTFQTSNSGFEIHFAFDRFFIGTKGAFEPFG
jgi:hypothetical protein